MPSATNLVNEVVRYTMPLTKMSLKAFPGRTDTKGLVGSLMLSLAMIALLQFGERLDTLFFGGLFPVAGRVMAFTLIGLGTVMYGVVGGLIVADINPFIAIATGTSPQAPYWIFTNALHMFAAWIVFTRFKNVISWKACITFSIVATVLIVASDLPVLGVIFQLPVEKMIPMFAFQSIWSATLPAIFLRALLKVVRDAGFVEE